MCKDKCCCKCIHADSGVCDLEGVGEIGCGYTCDKWEAREK